MKKLMILFALVPVLAFGQVLDNTGVEHNIADAYLSAADSLHYLGTVSLLELKSPTDHIDSLALVVSNEDSLRLDIVVGLVNEYGDLTDSASVVPEAGATGYWLQYAAAGDMVVYPWYILKASLKTLAVGAKYMKVWANVYALGSEVASHAKKFKVRAMKWE